MGVINPQAYGQQTPAAQFALSKLAGSRGGKKSARRRKKKSAAVRVSRRRAAGKTGSVKRRRRSSPARLVKGSQAARNHMARLRRMRKRK